MRPPDTLYCGKYAYSQQISSFFTVAAAFTLDAYTAAIYTGEVIAYTELPKKRLLYLPNLKTGVPE